MSWVRIPSSAPFFAFGVIANPSFYKASLGSRLCDIQSYYMVLLCTVLYIDFPVHSRFKTANTTSLREGYPVFSRLSGTQTGNAPGHGDGGPGAKVHGKIFGIAEFQDGKHLPIRFECGLSTGSQRLFPYNPFKGVRPSKINRADATERRAFTVEEAQRLTEILPGEWPDMIRVCLYTGGQRLDDIATLQWKQIDMEGGSISMTAQKTKKHMNKPIILPLKEVLDIRLAAVRAITYFR